MMARSTLVLCAALCLPAPAPAAPPGDRTAALLARAWQDFRLEDYGPARFQFGELAARLPKGSADQEMALFGLGTTLANQRPDADRAGARKAFTDLLAQDAKGPLAPWARLALARLLHVVPVGETPDPAAARKAYQDVIDATPGHPAAEEAFIYQQSLLVATLKPADATAALAALTEFIAKHPGAKFLSAAWSLAAQCRQTLHQPVERLAAEIKALDTLEIDPSNPYMDKANQYWRIATVAEFEAGDLAAARRYYGLLIRDYPTDQRTYGAKAALVRMAALERRLRGGG